MDKKKFFGETVKVPVHQSGRKIIVKNDNDKTQPLSQRKLNFSSHQSEKNPQYSASAAEGDHFPSPEKNFEGSMLEGDKELGDLELIDASAGELYTSPISEKSPSDYHKELYVLERALKDSQENKPLTKSVLKTLREHLERYEVKDKEQNEKIESLEKQLEKTSDVIQKISSSGLSLHSNESKNIDDYFRTSLVKKDAELLQMENELEKKIKEFDLYKSETSLQIQSLMREREILHQNLHVQKQQDKQPQFVLDSSNSLPKDTQDHLRSMNKIETLSVQDSYENLSTEESSKTECENCLIMENKQEELMACRLAFESTMNAVRDYLENLAFSDYSEPTDMVSDDSIENKNSISSKNSHKASYSKLNSVKDKEFQPNHFKSVESQTTASLEQLSQNYLDHFNLLKKNINKKVEANSVCEMTVKELEKKLETKNKMIATLKEENDKYQQEINQLRKELENYEQKVSDLNRQWQEDLKCTENQHQLSLKSFNAQLLQLQEDLKKERENHAKTLSNFEKTLEQQKVQAEKLNVANQTDFSIIEKQIEGIEKRKNNLKTMQSNLSAQDEEIEYFKSQLSEVQKSYDYDLMSYCNQVQDLENELRSTKSEQLNLIKQLSECQSELRKSIRKNESLDREKTTAEATISELKHQLKASIFAEAERAKELEKCRCDLKKANNEIAQLSSRVKKLCEALIKNSKRVSNEDAERNPEASKPSKSEPNDKYSPCKSFDSSVAETEQRTDQLNVPSDVSSHELSTTIQGVTNESLTLASPEDSVGSIHDASTTVLISDVKKELEDASLLSNNLNSKLLQLQSEKNVLESRVNHLSNINDELSSCNKLLNEKILAYENKFGTVPVEKISASFHYHLSQGDHLEIKCNSLEDVKLLKEDVEKLKLTLEEKRVVEQQLNSTVEALQEKVTNYEKDQKCIDSRCHEGQELCSGEGDGISSNNLNDCNFVRAELKKLQLIAEKTLLQCSASENDSSLTLIKLFSRKLSDLLQNNLSELDLTQSNESHGSKKDVSEIESLYAAKIAVLEQKIAERAPFESLQEFVEKLDLEKENFLQKDFERQKQTAILIEKEEALRCENEMSKGSVKELSAKIASLNEEMNELREKLKAIEHHNEEQLEVIKSNESVQKEHKQLINDKNLLTNELEVLMAKKLELVRDIEILLSEKEKLKKSPARTYSEAGSESEEKSKQALSSGFISAEKTAPNSTLVCDANKYYADFANLDANLIVATSTPCPSKQMAIRNYDLKKLNFILETDENDLSFKTLNQENAPPSEDAHVSNPFIIFLEYIGNCKVLIEENRNLKLEKYNLSMKLQTLQNCFNDTRLKLDKVSQNCTILEKKIEEFESSEHHLASGDSSNESEAITISHLKEERNIINSKIKNLEHFFSLLDHSNTKNAETIKDILDLKEKVNSLLEYKYGSILRLKTYENKIYGLKNEIKELWDMNDDVLSRSQVNIDELKLNIENNVFQVFNNLQNQSDSLDLQKCSELIDFLLSEAKKLKVDLIEKKNNFNEIFLNQCSSVAETLKENVIKNLRNVNDENKLLADERKKCLEMIESQEKLIFQLQNAKSKDLEEACRQYYVNVLHELAKQGEVMDTIVSLLNTETNIDKFIRISLDNVLEEKKVMELQLAEEHAQRLALQTRLDMYEEEHLKKNQLCQELERKVVRSEVERQINNLELKRNQDYVNTLKLQLDFQRKITKATEDASDLESKVKTVEVKPPLKTVKSSLIPIPVSPQPTAHSQRRSESFDKNYKSPSQSFSRQSTCSSDILKTTRKMTKDHIDQIFSQRTEFYKNCRNFQKTLCQSLSLPEESLENVDFADIIHLKKKYSDEIAELRTALNEENQNIYDSLKEKFENYAQQQISLAIAKLKKEYDILMENEIDSLNSIRTVENQLLEFEFENQKCEELSQLYQKLQLKTTAEQTEGESFDSADNETIIQHFHNILLKKYVTSIKKTIAAWKTAVFTELSSILDRILKLNSITSVENMSESTPEIPKELKIDDNIKNLLSFHEDIIKVSNEFVDTFMENHRSAMNVIEMNLRETHNSVLNTIDEAAKTLIEPKVEEKLHNRIADLEKKKEDLEQEYEVAISLLRSNLDAESPEIRALLSAFRSSNKDITMAVVHLRQELEAKHKKEMVELRTYFEQKCADMEKQYSEDVVKQRSSNLYFSGSDSENELYVSISELQSKCSEFPYSVHHSSLENRKSFKEKISDSEEHLEKVKSNLEEKFSAELNLLKLDHMRAVETLTKEIDELRETHFQELESLSDLIIAAVKRISEENFETTGIINLKDLINHDNNVKNTKQFDFCLQKIEPFIKEYYPEKLNALKIKLTKEKDDWFAEEKKKLFEELSEKHQKELAEVKLAYENQMIKEVQKAVEGVKCEENEHFKMIRSNLEESFSKKLSEVTNECQKKIQEQLARSAIKISAISLDFENKIKELENNLDAEREKLKEFESRVEKDQEKLIKYQKEIMQSVLKKHEQDLKSLEDKKEREINEKTKNYRATIEMLQKDFNLELEAYKDHLIFKKNEFSESLNTQKIQHEYSMTELRKQLSKENADYENKLKTDLDFTMKETHEEIDNIKKERDFLKKISSTLRIVVNELANYLLSCEDEFNKAIIEEILRGDVVSEEDLSDSSMKQSSLNNTLNMPNAHVQKTKRVHFAPDVSGIIYQLNDNSFSNFIENQCDFSEDLRIEVNSCLERLKKEASTLLGLSAKNKNPHNSSNIINDGSIDLREIELLEKLRLSNQTVRDYKKVVNAHEKELDDFKERQIFLNEENKKLKNALASTENVSEGYGEGYNSLSSIEKALHNHAILQGRVQGMINTDWPNEESIATYEVISAEKDKIIEKLRSEIDKLRHDREDLLQQLKAADERKRNDQRFFEEQATERELEIDNFVQKIDSLERQLQAQEQERSLHTSFVTDWHSTTQKIDSVNNPELNETLEKQLLEKNEELKSFQLKYASSKEDLKAAVDKVWSLRDIISDLEAQLAAKNKLADNLEKKIHDLQCSQNHQEEDSVLQKYQNLPDEDEKAALRDEINNLRDQLHKTSSSDILCQLKAQLCEIEHNIIKRTKELENVYETIPVSSLSSPSEEISIREQLERMHCVSPNNPEKLRSQSLSPVGLPVDETNRLASAVQRLCRAEDIVIKRMRDDSEMLLKTQWEEMKAERDVLQQKLDNQLKQSVLIQQKCDLYRHKLEEKIKLEDIEMQEKLSELEEKLDVANSKIKDKDKQLQEMSDTLKKTKTAMEKYQNELKDDSRNNWYVIEQLKSENETLKVEMNEQQELLKRYCKENNEKMSLMNLVVEEKYADFDSLRKELLQMKKKSNEKSSSSLAAKPSLTLSSFSDNFTLGVSQSSSGFEKLRDAPKDIERSPLSPRMDQTSKSNASGNISVDHIITQPSLSSPEYAPVKPTSWISDIEKDAKISQLNNSLLELRSKIYDKNCRIEDLEAQLSSKHLYESSESSSRNEYQQLLDSEKHLRKNLDSVLLQQSQLKKDLSDKEREIQCLKNQLSEKEESSLKLSSDTQALKLVVDKLQKSIEEVKTNCKKVEEEKEALRSELEVVNRKNKEIKDELSQVMSSVPRLKQLEKDLESFHELSEKCENLQNKNDNLIESINDLIKDKTTVKNELGSLQEKVDSHEELNQNLKKQLDHVAAQKAELDKKCVFLSKEIEKINQEKVKVESSLQHSESECAKLKDELKRISEINESLRSQADARKLLDSKNGQMFRREKENDINCSNLRKAGSVENLVSVIQEELNESSQLDDSLTNTITSLVPQHQLPSPQSRSTSIFDQPTYQNQIKTLKQLLSEEQKKNSNLELSLKVAEETSNRRQNYEMYQSERIACLSLEKNALEERVQCLELELLNSCTEVNQLRQDLLINRKSLEQLQAEFATSNENHMLEINRITELQLYYKVALQKEEANCQELRARLKALKFPEYEPSNEQCLRIKLDEEQKKCMSLEVEVEKQKRNIIVLRNMLEKEQALVRLKCDDVDRLNAGKQSSDRKLLELESHIKLERRKIQTLKDKIKAIEENDVLIQKRRLTNEREMKFTLQRSENIQRELREENKRLRKELISMKRLREAFAADKFTQNQSCSKSLPLEGNERIDFRLREQGGFDTDFDFNNVKQLSQKLNEETSAIKAIIDHVLYSLDSESSSIKLSQESKLSELVLNLSSVKVLLKKLSRSEQYRKALIWQKRFLQIACHTHQENQEHTLSFLRKTSDCFEIYKLGKAKKKNKFKAAAICCIFIHRLKFLTHKHSNPLRLSSLFINATGDLWPECEVP